MKPILNKGEVVIADYFDEIFPGDIVFFKVEGKIYTHRIVAKIPFVDYFLEKGDAYNIPGLIEKKSIIAKLSFPRANYRISVARQFYYVLRWGYHRIRSYFSL